MTAEEKEAWRQAERTAYQLLMDVERRQTETALIHIQELDLLIEHLQRIEVRERRTGGRKTMCSEKVCKNCH